MTYTSKVFVHVYETRHDNVESIIRSLKGLSLVPDKSFPLVFHQIDGREQFGCHILLIAHHLAYGSDGFLERSHDLI